MKKKNLLKKFIWTSSNLPEASSVVVTESAGVYSLAYSYSHPNTVDEAFQETQWEAINIAGDTAIGSILTASVLPVGTYTYQWYAADNNQGLNDGILVGETANTITLVDPTHIDKLLRVEATDINGDVYSSYYTSTIGYAVLLEYVMVEEGKTTEVMAVFDKEITLTDSTGFTSEKNDVNNPITAVVEFENVLIFTLTNPIAANDLITLSYDSGLGNASAFASGLILGDITKIIGDNYIGALFADRILITYSGGESKMDGISWNSIAGQPYVQALSFNNLIDDTGISANGTVTCIGVLAGDTVTVNGLVFTAQAVDQGTDWSKFDMSGTDITTAQSLARSMYNDGRVGTVVAYKPYSRSQLDSTNICDVRLKLTGSGGDGIALSSSDGVRLAVSGATLTGGIDAIGTGINVETRISENNNLSSSNDNGNEFLSLGDFPYPVWWRSWGLYDDNGDFTEEGRLRWTGFSKYQPMRIHHAIRQKSFGTINHQLFRSTGHVKFNPKFIPAKDVREQVDYMVIADSAGGLDMALRAGSPKEDVGTIQLSFAMRGSILERVSDFNPRTEDYETLLMLMGMEEISTKGAWFNWGTEADGTKGVNTNLPTLDADRWLACSLAGNTGLDYSHTALTTNWEIWLVIETPAINSYQVIVTPGNIVNIRLSSGDLFFESVNAGALVANTEYRIRVKWNGASSTYEVRDNTNSVYIAETIFSSSGASIGVNATDQLFSSTTGIDNFNGRARFFAIKPTAYDTAGKNNMFDWIHDKIK